MRILHYSLGFPPYRTGGLTKFCMDLIKQQIEDGHDVALMWPGKMGILLHKVYVRERGLKDYDGVKIRSFEVINPLPVSYDEGISKFDAFTYGGDAEPYWKLLEKYNPDVVHIHTLMGLHKAFLEVATEKKVKTVFTAHDFFPICPKVTMFRYNQICDSVLDCNECAVCNTTALSINKIRILQLPIYRKFKNSLIIKKIRKHHRDAYLNDNESVLVEKPIGKSEDFKKLRTYYFSMLKLMDIIHYNSTVTKEVYEKFLGEFKNVVIPISHVNISDQRKIKSFKDGKIRIRYLGPYAWGKGYFYLKEALDKLWNERKDFSLDIHFSPRETSPYIRTYGRYNYSELEEIFNQTDILVAPSVWYETFGYTVLEALSYGVPVLITETVGAKDILEDGAGIVIEDIKSNQLYNAISSLNVDMLRSMNKVIVDKQSILTVKDMSEMIESQCYH